MIKTKNTTMLIILVAMLVFIIPAVLSISDIEGFISGGSYPCSLNQPLLADVYKVKNPSTSCLPSPSGFCGGLYEITEPNTEPEPQAPSWSEIPRVNFYVSTSAN